MRTKTAKKWSIHEASLVAIPADRRAKTRSREVTGRADTNRQIRTLGDQAQMSREAIDALIDREATIEEAQTAALESMTTRSSISIRTAEHRTLDNPVEFVRAAGEALFAAVNRQHTPSGPVRQLGFSTISDAARECLRRSGEHLMTTAPAVVITRALNTTSDFPLLLGDTVGRVLRASYEAVPSALRRLARQVSAPDFRERASLVLDAGSFKLEKVNEHGEFKSGSFVESGEKYKLATYGKIFGITRQALVNDDLGALTDVPTKLGQQAAAFEAQYLVDLLASGNGFGPTFSDGEPLFDAAHGNLAPAGAAPDSTSLTAARLAQRKQTGPGGELINVVPRFLVVPAELETAAQTLLTEITPSTVEDVSIWSSLLDLIVEPRLSNPARWYLVADPAASGLEVAYLTGNEGPQTETQSGFRIDGVETKVRLDFVAALVDWRGIYMNPGAAP
ncbi:MAG: prohead protease/major capsid protein fusion protein [Methyloceanibacter sp.]